MVVGVLADFALRPLLPDLTLCEHARLSWDGEAEDGEEAEERRNTSMGYVRLYRRDDMVSSES